MHLTFLPNKEKDVLRREYFVRILIVGCFMLSVAGVIGMIFLYPSFSSALSTKKSALLSVVEDKTDENIISMSKELSFDNRLLMFFGTQEQELLLSSVINEIVSVRGSVRLKSLNIERVSTTSVAIVVSGIASTRQSLLSFKNRLESSMPGSMVELPVSELADQTDIKFSLAIKRPMYSRILQTP